MLPGITPSLIVPTTFPVVANYATTNSAESTSHVINMPSGIVAGDLLLLLSATAGVTGPPAGWTQLDTASAFYRVASGTGADVATVGVSGMYTLTAVTHRIVGYLGVPQSLSNALSNTTPDPPALSPAWGMKNTLWFVQCTTPKPVGSGSAIIGTPANYTDGIHLIPQTEGPNNYILWTGRRRLRAATEDPSAFTTTVVYTSRARTIAVQGIQ